ncbi:hypothetical protein PGB90_000986 [Kerria lacca]
MLSVVELQTEKRRKKRERERKKNEDMTLVIPIIVKPNTRLPVRLSYNCKPVYLDKNYYETDTKLLRVEIR